MPQNGTTADVKLSISAASGPNFIDFDHLPRGFCVYLGRGVAELRIMTPELEHQCDLIRVH